MYFFFCSIFFSPVRTMSEHESMWVVDTESALLDEEDSPGRNDDLDLWPCDDCMYVCMYGVAERDGPSR